MEYVDPFAREYRTYTTRLEDPWRSGLQRTPHRLCPLVNPLGPYHVHIFDYIVIELIHT